MWVAHPAPSALLDAFSAEAYNCVLSFEKSKLGEKCDSKKKPKKTVIKNLILHNIEEAAAKYLLEGLVHPKSADKEELIYQLTNELHFIGMNIYFESFPLATLHDLCYEMELEDDPKGITSNKALLINSIINQEEVKLSKKGKKTIVMSKKKKPIKEGISVWDIVGHYSSEELTTWCKDNKLKSSGTKKEMAKRIIAFLGGDKENTMAQPRASKSSNQKAPKKTELKATQQKSVTIKNEVDVAQQEKEEVDDDDDKKEDDDLDLDNLGQYDIKTLRAYCEEEKIDVQGNRKQDYIKAIELYNVEEGEEAEEQQEDGDAEQEDEDGDDEDDDEEEPNQEIAGQLPEEVLDILGQIEDNEGNWTMSPEAVTSVNKLSDNLYHFTFTKPDDDDEENEEGKEEKEVSYEGYAQTFCGKWFVTPKQITEQDCVNACKATWPVVKADILNECEDEGEEETEKVEVSHSDQAVQELYGRQFSMLYGYWPFHSDEDGLSKQQADGVVMRFDNVVSDHGIWCAFTPGSDQNIEAYTFN